MTNAERHEELQQAVRELLDLLRDGHDEDSDQLTALRGRLARLANWNG